MTKTEALTRFGVHEGELAGLQFFSKTSARNFQMKLYLESQLAGLMTARGNDGGGRRSHDSGIASGGASGGVGGETRICGEPRPGDASKLRVAGNDTCNSFQCANKGRSVSTAEWKAARAKLLARHNGVRGAAEEAAAEVESDLEEAAAEKIAELAEQIAEKDTLRIKFTVGDSFAPGTVVGVTPGEVLVDAQDEEFQVGNNN